MALAVPSSALYEWATASAADITKPANLAVGDLMIAALAWTDTGSTVTSTTPTGWTAVRQTDITNFLHLRTFYKVAVSADVAASSFGFSLSESTTVAGGILRITGHPAAGPYTWADNGATASDTANPTFADTVTTGIASSMLIFPACCKTGVGTVATMAVATSNPSWTIVMQDNNGTTHTFAIGYATRPETTATGDSSITSDVAATADWIGQLLSIPPSKDVTVADSTTVSDSKVLDADSIILDTSTVTDTITADRDIWSNPTKPATSWVFPSK